MLTLQSPEKPGEKKMSAGNKKKLRTGFTTGAAAAAAAKAALQLILDTKPPESIEITFLTGEKRVISVFKSQKTSEKTAVCSVIKDAGDDPDVTHKAEIGARVSFYESDAYSDILIRGGEGVGTITKPGLEIPPGEPAINSGPRKMINQEIKACLLKYNTFGQVSVEIFVPKGVKLAKKTLNERLGILGGLSILGTTGIERPLSHEAYITTIDLALSVSDALNCTEVVFTTGRRSERYAQKIWNHKPKAAFIQIGDYFAKAVQLASSKSMTHCIFTVFFGKAIKIASGVACTHAKKSELKMSILADWVKQITCDIKFAEKIRNANTARHAFMIINEQHPIVIDYIGKKVIESAFKYSGSKMRIGCVILDYEGKTVFKRLDQVNK